MDNDDSATVPVQSADVAGFLPRGPTLCDLIVYFQGKWFTVAMVWWTPDFLFLSRPFSCVWLHPRCLQTAPEVYGQALQTVCLRCLQRWTKCNAATCYVLFMYIHSTSQKFGHTFSFNWIVYVFKCVLYMTVWCAWLFPDQGSGFCVTGKIEAGYIQTGDRMLAMPPNETCTVKGTCTRTRTHTHIHTHTHTLTKMCWGTWPQFKVEPMQFLIAIGSLWLYNTATRWQRMWPSCVGPTQASHSTMSPWTGPQQETTSTSPSRAWTSSRSS